MIYDLAVIVASYNTLSTREEGLYSCLDSIRDSYNQFKMNFPDKEVIVSWVDDASTDNTPDIVGKYFDDVNIPFKLTRLKVNSHQAYARNLAAKVIKSDVLTFCDSDDAFLPNHLTTCYELISTCDSEGHKLGAGSTICKIDPKWGVHPDWIGRISGTIPITKVIRSEVFEFMEGFPVNDIYKITGCEDQAFIQILSKFFTVLVAGVETVEYKNYPGSFFDKQLPKFRQHPDNMVASQDDMEKGYLHDIRLKFEANLFDYLKRKLVGTDWSRRLEKYVVTYI